MWHKVCVSFYMPHSLVCVLGFSHGGPLGIKESNGPVMWVSVHIILWNKGGKSTEHKKSLAGSDEYSLLHSGEPDAPRKPTLRGMKAVDFSSDCSLPATVYYS